MRPCKTDILLNGLNALRAVEYGQKGYTFFQNVTGDGRTYRTIYAFSGHGGVTRSELNARGSRKQCDNIRAAITLEASK